MQKNICLCLLALTLTKIPAQHSNNSLASKPDKFFTDNTHQASLPATDNRITPTLSYSENNDREQPYKQDTIRPASDIKLIAAFGDKGYEYGRSITTDKNGYIYVTGSFEGPLNQGETPAISKGGDDIFVAKYHKSGMLEWLQSAGGAKTDMGSGIAVDEEGNVYIIGNFRGTATFGKISKTVKGIREAFIVKYNSSGNVQWVQTVSGISHATAITLDRTGNVYVGGAYNGSTTLGTSAKTSRGGFDVFLAKYNSDGKLQWSESIGGPYEDNVNGIALDSKGNVYITGDYNTKCTFGSITKTAGNKYGNYLAKYNQTTRKWIWVNSIVKNNSESSFGVVVDLQDNVYITGAYSDNTTFGSIDRKSVGITDIFILKYNTDGNMEWVESIGGESSDRVMGLAIDNTDHLYILGNYESATALGPISLKVKNYFKDYYVAKYNPKSRNWIWVQSTGGTDGRNNALGFAADADGQTYVTGQYYHTSTFGEITRNCNGGSDIFVIRLNK